MNAHIIRINPVEIYFFGRSLDIISNIVQCRSQVVDILPVEWCDKILSQFSEDLVCIIIIHVLHIFNLFDEFCTFIKIGFVDHFFQFFTHAHQYVHYAFKELKKYPVLG